MKNYLKLFILLFVLVCSQLQAQDIPKNPNKTDKDGKRQGKWTIWYDKDWKIINDEKGVEFFRIITYKDDKPVGLVKDHYKNGIDNQKHHRGIL